MGLTKLAIFRPVLIVMVMLLCIFGGWSAFRSMRKEQNPDVQFGVASITTIYPGAGPEEMNTLVSRRIEEAVSSVNNLLEVTALSQEGVSVVVCNFEVGTNMDVALSDIRSKVDRVVNSLPQDAEKPVVSKFDTTSDPILTLSVSSDRLNSQQLRDLVDDKIKDRIAQVQGVADVSVTGGDIREIQVQVQQEKLLAYGIGIVDVQRAIQAASLNVPSGRIVTDGRETAVRVLGEFKSAEEMRNTYISISDPKNPQGKAAAVRLGDIARIEDSVTERRAYSRLNGTDALTISVQKAREGNAIEITKAVEKLMPQLEAEYGLKFVKTFESAKLIAESLEDLTVALFLGIILVMAIVWLFLHDWRGTIIVGIAIPVCLLATIAILKILGFTINNLSMLALSLAIGVLVDDAIVVLENIYRHLKMGEEPIEAAINGRNEIGLAAIAITLADVVVFVPVGAMGGIVGQFFKPLGYGFAICVALSLLVSFTITPMLAARWYKAGEDIEHPKGRFAQWFERTFERFAHTYQRSLRWALHHRWFVFISGFIVLFGVFMGIAGSFAPDYAGAVKTAMPLFMLCVILGVVTGVVNVFRRHFKFKQLLAGVGFGAFLIFSSVVGHAYGAWKKDSLFKFQFFPQTDSGQVQIVVQLPPGANLKSTENVVARLEKVAQADPDVKYVVSRIGSKGGGFNAADQGTNYAQINVTLYDKDAWLERIKFWAKHEEKVRHRSDSTIAADMLYKIGKVPGAVVTVSAGQQQGFGSPIQMSFRSDDRALLQETAQKVKAGLQNNAIEGVINVDISSKPGKPEIQAIPDRARLADSGVSASELATAMRTMYEGNTNTKFRVLGREYDIRVMMALEDRNNRDLVSQVPLTFQQGEPIYVSSVSNLREALAVDKIERRSRQEEIRITADLLPGKTAGNVQQEINNWIEKEKLLPEGVAQKNLGQADVQAREGIYLMTALVTGILLVYALLASLYNNYLYPFIIQLAQPQALVGALLALILTDKSLNIVGFIGVIALVGLVGKNAILLVDYTNTLRSRGLKREEALLTAGPIRLRPIMMTTIAVILGMLPVALAIGKGSEFRETIGITIIGGVLLSTILTLLVIPCSYTIFDDISRSLMKRLGKSPSEFEDVAPKNDLVGSGTPS